ncbi:MAG TPA: RidA family protein [Candidatus Paceibacterota bacterium]|nr:RidA family protein [Candidatus Paceibacterota bacterium]
MRHSERWFAMQSKHIYTRQAPEPGAYSQGILVDPLKHHILFLAGQTGNVPDLPHQPVAKGGVAGQTWQALRNILAVVRAAGGSLCSLVSLDVFLKDGGSAEARRADREAFNTAYKEFFADRGITEVLPARTFVWVPEVPLEFPAEDTLVEIRAIAAIPRP